MYLYKVSRYAISTIVLIHDKQTCYVQIVMAFVNYLPLGYFGLSVYFAAPS